MNNGGPHDARRRILVFAYACEPGKGSEPGAGWTWVRMLARLEETWVITRANNRESIEAVLPSLPEADRLRFVYVDLPRWARFWKRGQRGVRLYYFLWQVAAVLTARGLQREVGFDLVWHLTLANGWFGSLAPLAGRPFVYGPVGGGIRIPWRLVPSLGVRGAGYELLRELARALGRYFNPLARLAWRRAKLILVQNPETAGWLPRTHRAKAEVFPNALLADLEIASPTHNGRLGQAPTALFAGRLLAFKGLALALRAVAQAPEWRLVIYGEGPDRQRLERIARRLGVEARVEFRGWVPQEEVWRTMREEADAFLFPSLHEEAGFVVVEASACRLPIICLDIGGPALLSGEWKPVVSQGGAAAVSARLAAAMRDAEAGRDSRAAAIPAWQHAEESLRLHLASHLREESPR